MYWTASREISWNFEGIIHELLQKRMRSSINSRYVVQILPEIEWDWSVFHTMILRI